MRSVYLFPVAVLALSLTAPGVARSQAHYGAPDPFAGQPRANYGGGFIEMLVTGRDPTPRGAVYNRPGAVSAYGQTRRRAPDPIYGAEPVYGGGPAYRGEPVYGADPFERPRQSGRRVAALGEPVAPTRPIERVIDPRFQKQEVAYDGRHRPGTVVIDTRQRFLFLVQSNGRALRYGIGVGRVGFSWTGTNRISRKAEWPTWTPPAAMLKRRPDLPRFMKGGPENPMGARALYLGSTLYRIHGTNEPHTIGQAVSSGCIRMTNNDVIDLYNRVPVGATVVVL